VYFLAVTIATRGSSLLSLKVKLNRHRITVKKVDSDVNFLFRSLALLLQHDDTEHIPLKERFMPVRVGTKNTTWSQSADSKEKFKAYVRCYRTFGTVHIGYRNISHGPTLRL
jgi:hypothetical protein